MTSVMRPDPRYELSWVPQVPHSQTEHPDTSAVAVTVIRDELFGICRSAIYDFFQVVCLRQSC